MKSTVPYATGADKSPYDVRTFAYVPSGVPHTGGKKYTPKDIEDQHKVGICTAISLTQNARKALSIRFSAEFQYLLQKKLIDGNWNEGSSISTALKVAQKYGLLPEKEWTFTKESDRKLSYDKYIKKLQAVPTEEITKLLKKAAKYKITAYSKVPIDRDFLAQAITESAAGLLVRHVVGKEWWTRPVEPLRPVKDVISGHAVTESNYAGRSFRIANSWGTDWADNGTAYRLHDQTKPTEAWLVHYGTPPDAVKAQLKARTSIWGKTLNVIQKLINLI
jgi:hypothetical protein